MYFNIMFGLSIAATGYIVLNFFVLWLGKEDSEDVRVTGTNNATNSNNLAVQKFQESLDGGKLGRISEEVKICE